MCIRLVIIPLAVEDGLVAELHEQLAHVIVALAQKLALRLLQALENRVEVSITGFVLATLIIGNILK